MKVYVGDNKREAKQISFQELLIHKLKEASFKMDNGGFWDENYSWVGIIQDSEKLSRILVNISFNVEQDTIATIDVYETPIVTILDEDNTKRLV